MKYQICDLLNEAVQAANSNPLVGVVGSKFC